MIYLSSDLHFLHDRAFIWNSRGFESIDEMNEEIIKRFNEVVQSDDTLYLLGDIALGGGSQEALDKAKSLIERINCSLYIFRGNHDTDNRISMYRDCKNVAACGLWSNVLKYKGYHFYMSHFPTLTANLERESLKQCTCNLFGHTHQTTNFYMDMPMYYHVGVDSHNCYPVSLDSIIDEMENKVKECLELL